MKIGDTVSFAAGLDRHPEFGKLLRIETVQLGPRRIEMLICVIRAQDGQVVLRSLKRVKTVEAGRKHAGVVAKRNAKRRMHK